MNMQLRWNLRQLLAQREIFKTTKLVPLLAEHGVNLSREQVFRLVTSTPQRLNLDVLRALCEILECEPNDLLVFESAEKAAQPERRAVGKAPAVSVAPTPARIARPRPQGIDHGA